MPSAVAHRELAAEPRPWQRMPCAAREPHDVVDGQEVRLVFQLGDQRQLVLDQRSRTLRRYVPVGKAPRRSPSSVSCAQIHDAGVSPARHQLFRIFVAQAVEREIAALGDAQRLEQAARADRVCASRCAARRCARRWETAHGRIRRPACFKPDRGQRVLQRAARAHVHVHVAGGDQRQCRCARASACKRCEPRAVVGPAQQLDRDPRARRKRACEPARIVEVQRFDSGSSSARQPGRPRSRSSRVAGICLSCCACAAAGDQLGKIAVAFAVGGEQDTSCEAIGERGISRRRRSA